MGKRTASAETLKPDPRYNSKLASKFVNCLMWQGKKATANRIFYGALDQIKKRMPDLEPIDVFNQAIEHVKPVVEVRSKRVGGATYQVPIEVSPNRSSTLAMRWMLDAARAKSGKALAERIAEEILAANKKEGIAFKKREDTHKMAEANRAFAHYRW
jgi:small subunit ribosomal protein S7